jgi:hypothetical protein
MPSVSTEGSNEHGAAGEMLDTPAGTQMSVRTPPDTTPKSGNPAPVPAIADAPARDEAVWPADCEQRVVFRAHGAMRAGDTSKYRVPAGEQFVAMFYFKAPWNADLQLVKTHAVIDNPKIVHHWGLMVARSDEAFDNTIQGSQDAWAMPIDGGEAIIAGARGGTQLNLPADVGLRLPPGPNLVFELEVHYYNAASDQDEEDATSVEVCVTSKKRRFEAAIHGLGAESFELPAHTQTNVTSTCVPSPQREPIHVLAVNPHMHLTGRRTTMVVNRKSGEQITVLDEPYDFLDQRTYTLPTDRSAADVVLNPGDTITTTCHYDNDTDASIEQGMRSEQEMCETGVLAWPAGALHNSYGDLLRLLPSVIGGADLYCLTP